MFTFTLRSKLVLLLLLQIIERFISFYLYQFFKITFPPVIIDGTIFLILLTIPQPPKARITAITLFVAYATYFSSILNSTSGYGNLLFWINFIYITLILSSDLIENISPPLLNGKKIAWFTLILLSAYTLSSLWGEIYYANNQDAREGLMYGFIWPHSMGYWVLALGLNLIAYRYIFFSIALSLFGLTLPSRIATMCSLILLTAILHSIRSSPIKHNKPLSMLKNISLLNVFFIITLLLWYKWSDITSVDRAVSTLMMISDVDNIQGKTLSLITSGRSWFWYEMYDYFFSNTVPTYNHILGISPSVVKELNQQVTGLYIWMHNDWLESLYSYGICGFLIYTYAITNFIKNTSYNIFISTFILFATLLNGFFPYHCIPFIILSYNYITIIKNRT